MTSGIPLAFVDQNRAWLDLVCDALKNEYDIHTAEQMEHIDEPYPGGVFSLVFIVWRNTDKQKQQISEFCRTPRGKGRTIILLPRREDSAKELVSLFLLGAYDVEDKPQTSQRLNELVAEKLRCKYRNSKTKNSSGNLHSIH